MGLAGSHTHPGHPGGLARLLGGLGGIVRFFLRPLPIVTEGRSSHEGGLIIIALVFVFGLGS